MDVAEKLRMAARGWEGGTGRVIDNAKVLFDCEGELNATLFRAIADEIQAERETKGGNGMILKVATFDTHCTGKEQAVKVLEEAAEAFGAWQTFRAVSLLAGMCLADAESLENTEINLEDELADVITAACNLAERYNLDMKAAMERCEQRNHERGRL